MDQVGQGRLDGNLTSTVILSDTINRANGPRAILDEWMITACLVKVQHW